MTTIQEDESVMNGGKKTSPRRVLVKKRPFDPPAIMHKWTVVSIGIGLFSLALFWPPLILVVTYVCSQIIPYAFRKNDDPTWRRKEWKKFIQRPDLPEQWKNQPNDIVYEESYWSNERGMCLLTYTMVPADQEVKAVVCLCHGYTDHSSYFKRVEYQRFVRKGIAIVAIEYEGHGRSDGPLGLVSDWNLLIDDTSSFFQDVCGRKFPGKKVFLMGESMGGAVCFSTYERLPDFFSGVVFVAPMCKIADDMLPPQWVIRLLMAVIGEEGTDSFLGSLPIAPARGDLRELSYHLAEKRDIVQKSPTCFCRHPRLATARELLKVTTNISHQLESFDAPFLVQHGREDRVTDPMLSQALYDESCSHDKTIKLYNDMWHTITGGETDEDTDIVFSDAISWVMARI